MRTTVKFLVYGIMVLAFSITSCSKDGEIGPMGPQGPQGEQGEQGIQGETGTANVIYSEWTAMDSWSTDFADFKYGRFPDLLLTEDQIKNDAILVYRKYNRSPTNTLIHLLSYHEFNATTGDLELKVESAVQGNGIVFFIQSYGRDLLEKEYSGPDTMFKYVIIAGGIPSATSKAPDFTKMTYEEVMDHFGLDY